jgi:DNA repair exonuclease SbcCD nuclease subunit
VLQNATFEAYSNIIDLCIRERVDALLVAGDIYDGADRSLRAQLRFIEGLRRLDDAGIRSFICHGNHDPLDGWESKLELPPGCHRFSVNVERVPVFTNEPGRAAIYGVSYPTRDVRRSLIPGFGKAQPGVFSIGLLHANVNGNPNHEAYAPCTLAELAETGIDYWALGHVHTREVLSERAPCVVYPGNSQGRHPNERGARGVYLVEVSDSGQVSRNFRPVDVVRWENIEIDISGMDTQAMITAIDDRVSETRDESDGRPVIIRIELTGRGPAHHDLVRPGALDDIASQVNDTWAAQRPFAWCERVTAATGSPIDRNALRQGSDFVGDLLRLIDELKPDDATIAALSATLSELYERGNARQYLRDGMPDNDEIRTLLAEAEELCLAQLVEEDAE